MFYLDDRWLLERMTEDDRAELRAVARSGDDTEDRAHAAVALARLRDESAAGLLADLIADPACHLDTAWALGRGAYESVETLREHAGLLTPWLLELLNSDDNALRLHAAWVCQELHITTAGPLLLRLARAAIAEMSSTEDSWSPIRFLTAAAHTWPSSEVSDELRRWLEPATRQLAEWTPPVDAVSALAANAEPGVYEWALEWCAEQLMTWCSPEALKGLLARGRESLPLLERVVRESRNEQAAAEALETVAALDLEAAEHCARAVWKRIPLQAAEVLGMRYRGTADPDAAELVVRIAESTRQRWEFCDALVRIGGPVALAAADRAIEKLSEQDRYSDELPRLRSLVAHGAPAHELAAELIDLDMIPRSRIEESAAELGGNDPVSPYDLLLAAFKRAGRLVQFDAESGFYPPDYDDLLREFADATDGAIQVDDIRLTPFKDEDEPDDEDIDDDELDGFRLTFTHNGETLTREADDFEDYYDLDMTGWMATSLEPADPADPRRFIEVGNDASTFLFADPAKLVPFCKRNEIDVPCY